MTAIKCTALSKVFDDGTTAVEDVSLEVRSGELMVLMGPSGSGKSTVLRLIAGLEEASAGSVHLGDQDVTRVEPGDRDVAMVFQSYALYPTLSVARNLGFALRMRGVRKDVIEREVADVAARLGLTELLHRKPGQLSGGQRQRVAMGRAIVRHPKAFLMDEPLSNLDANLRIEMRAEILQRQRELGITTIYVTHDQSEAMTMGDRVTVMRDGRIVQVGTPDELYRRPASLFVARALGSPPMNVLTAQLARDDDRLVCGIGSARHRLPEDLIALRPGLERFVGARVDVGIRPERLRLPADQNGSAWHLPVGVRLVEGLGAEKLVHFTVSNGASEAHLIGRFDPDFTATEGTQIELVVDPADVQFFDTESGEAIA